MNLLELIAPIHDSVNWHKYYVNVFIYRWRQRLTTFRYSIECNFCAGFQIHTHWRYCQHCIPYGKHVFALRDSVLRVQCPLNHGAGTVPCETQDAELCFHLLFLQAPDVALKPRLGGIEIKGKGHMRTFWVSAGSGVASSGSIDALLGSVGERGFLPAGPQPVDRWEFFGFVFCNQLQKSCL